MTVPMSHQRLQRDLLEDIKTDLKQGRAVSGEDLLRSSSGSARSLLSLATFFPLFLVLRCCDEVARQMTGLAKILSWKKWISATFYYLGSFNPKT